MGMSGSFKIVRTPASYIIFRSGQGKWENNIIFLRISANYSNAYPGMPYEIWRPAGSENVVAMQTQCYHFSNQSYGFSKSTESNQLGPRWVNIEAKNTTLNAYLFLFDAAYLQKKILRFDPTLSSHNSGLKSPILEKYHIFGKPWTSAFTWLPLEKSY